MSSAFGWRDDTVSSQYVSWRERRKASRGPYSLSKVRHIDALNTAREPLTTVRMSITRAVSHGPARSRCVFAGEIAIMQVGLKFRIFPQPDAENIEKLERQWLR